MSKRYIFFTRRFVQNRRFYVFSVNSFFCRLTVKIKYANMFDIKQIIMEQGGFLMYQTCSLGHEIRVISNLLRRRMETNMRRKGIDKITDCGYPCPLLIIILRTDFLLQRYIFRLDFHLFGAFDRDCFARFGICFQIRAGRIVSLSVHFFPGDDPIPVTGVFFQPFIGIG